MSNPAFLALAPDERLSAAIQNAKDTVLRLAGPQKYLADPPHLTLMVGCYADPERTGEAFAAAAQNWRRPSVQLSGWHVFRDDPLTGGHTVVCKITPETMPALRSVQHDVLQISDAWRDQPASMQRYAAARERLTPIRQASLDRWGFPFTGADWHPHVSVASITPAAWDAVWPALVERAPQGTASFVSLRWYRLDVDRPVLLREIPLQ